MTKEVAKQDAQAPAPYQQQPAGGVLKSDILIPRLLLMQQMSDFVVEKTNQSGQFVRSTNREVLGGEKTPVEFIPLSFQTLWILQEKVGKKFEFRKMLPRDAGFDDARKPEEEKTGEGLPWEFKKNGTEWKRVKLLNVFALLPGDIAAFLAELERAKKENDMPDFNKVIMPIAIGFRSTSYNAGKKVATQFAKAQSMAQFGVKPYGYTLKLSAYQDSNDQGTFYVMDVSEGRKSSPAENQEAAKWLDILGTSAIKVDDAVESDSAEASERAVSDRF